MENILKFIQNSDPEDLNLFLGENQFCGIKKLKSDFLDRENKFFRTFSTQLICRFIMQNSRFIMQKKIYFAKLKVYYAKKNL
jgi:hypothetical protein